MRSSAERRGQTPKLTNNQSRNLVGFEKESSKENRNIRVPRGRDGTITVEDDVLGKAHGLKAVYERTVDVRSRLLVWLERAPDCARGVDGGARCLP